MNQKTTFRIITKRLIYSGIFIFAFFSFSTTTYAAFPLWSAFSDYYDDYTSELAYILYPVKTLVVKVTPLPTITPSILSETSATSPLPSVTTKPGIISTPSTKVIYLPGPQGPAGPQGIPGPQGLQGPAGLPGGSSSFTPLSPPSWAPPSNNNNQIIGTSGGYASLGVQDLNATTLNVTGSTTLTTLTAGNSTLAAATISGNLTVSGTITGSVTGTINPSLTLGSVFFQGASGIAQDNANFFWDDTNDRLGIGTNAPSRKFDVIGSASVGGTTTSNINAGLIASIPGTTWFGSAPTASAIYIEASGFAPNTYSIYSVDNAPSYFFGNIGIGTTNPTGKLDVAGTAIVRQSGGTVGTDELQISHNGTTALLYNPNPGSQAFKFRFNNTSSDVDLDLGWTSAQGITFTPQSGNLLFDTTSAAYGLKFRNNGTEMAKVDQYGLWASAVYPLSAGSSLIGNNANPFGAVYSRALYSDSGQSLLFGINASEKMRIDTNGNVGIGTTNPLHLLSLASSSNAPLLNIASSNSGASAYTQMALTGTGRAFNMGVGNSTETTRGVANKWFLYDSTADAMRMVVDTNGNVGIGNTTPTSNLDIIKNQDAVSRVRITNTNSGTGSATEFNAYNGTYQATFGLGGTGMTSYGIQVANSAGIYNNAPAGIYLQADNASAPIVFQTGGHTAEAMRITSAGNVGIGTTGPSEKLVIGNDLGALTSSPARAMVMGNTGGDSLGYFGQASNANFNFAWRYNATAASARAQIATYGYANPIDIDASAVVLQGQGGGGNVGIGGNPGTAKLYINGNVGIGTTGPVAPLMVKRATSSGLPASSGTTQTGIVSRLAVSDGDSVMDFGMEGPLTGKGWIQMTNSTNLATNYSLLLNPNGGNVGIGTTAPGAKLQVNGTVNVGPMSVTEAIILSPAARKISLEASTADGSLAFLNGGSETNRLISNGNGASLGMEGIWGANTVASIQLNRAGDGNANGTITFSTGQNAAATARMRIDSTGNVGIGTTAPDAKLQIAASGAPAIHIGSLNKYIYGLGAEDDDIPIFQTYATGGSYYGLGQEVYGSFLASYDLAQNANAHLSFYVNSLPASNGAVASPKMYISSAGNVGIGTTGPTSLLHVQKDQNGATEIKVQNATSGTGAESAFVLTNDAGIVGKLGLYSSGTNSFGAIAANNSYLYNNSTGIALMANNASGVIKFATGGTGEKMRIDTNGNVGIGTTAPGSSLHIKGAGNTYSTSPFRIDNSSNTNTVIVKDDGRVYMGTDVGTNSILTVNRTTGNAITNLVEIANADGLDLAISSNASVFSYLISGSSGLLAFGNSGVASSQFVIDTASGVTNTLYLKQGNVGIGTTAPSQLLHMYANTNADVRALVQNVANSASTSATLQIDVGGTSAADPTTVYTISGGSTWALGTDNSDSDSFKISQNATLGTNDRLTILTGGNVGIGTTGPGAKLQVSGDIITTATAGNVMKSTAFISNQLSTIGEFGVEDAGMYFTAGTDLHLVTNGADRLNILSGGNVGVGDTTPDALFDVKGTVCLDLNADDVCNDNTAAVSDSRLKTNVSNITNGLDLVRQLHPVNFTWNGEYNTGNSNSLGFLAQEVESLFPNLDLVITDTAGYKRLDYSKLTAVLASAVQELDLKINSIIDINNLNVENSWRDSLVAWFSNTSNGIGGMFANVFNAKEKICVDGECLTKDDIRVLLDVVNSQTGNANQGGGGSPTPEPQPEPDPTPEPEPQPEPTPDPIIEPEPDVNIPPPVLEEPLP